MVHGFGFRKPAQLGQGQPQIVGPFRRLGT